MEISSFATIATLVVSGLYPDASESLLQLLSKSMTERYTRLLYWKHHDKKLRADRRFDGRPYDVLVQTQPKSTSSTILERPQRQNSIENITTSSSKPEASKVSVGTTLISGSVPSITAFHHVIPPAEGEAMVQRQAPASSVGRSGVKFPSPPRFENGEDKKPCPFCRKIFTKVNYEDAKWWRWVAAFISLHWR